MATTPEQIQQDIITAKEANADLQALNSTSKSAIWRLIIYIVSFSIFTLEKLFDLHVADVDNKLALLMPHTKLWYRQKALAFQLGFALVTDADYYDNSLVDPQVVEDSRIIKYSAVTESQVDSRIIIKIATEVGGKLQPITAPQKESFDEYISEIKDAGVQISVINFLPDLLYLTIRIFRDPLVIDAEGNSILSGGKPVEEAIKAYLKNLPFDGELVLAHLTDSLQKVPGVVIPQIDAALSSWIDADTNGYGNAESINVRTIPVSGYFEIVDFIGVSYVV